MNFIKKVTSYKLFLPIFCLILVLLINLFKSPEFFKISINNGVLYGRLIDVLNRGSEIAILAIGMTLVVAVSAGTDISVGSVMALSAAVCCRFITGGAQKISSPEDIVTPIVVSLILGILMGGICGTFNGFLVSKLKIQPMVATLILFTAARAIGLVVCNNGQIFIRLDEYKIYGNFIGKCPIPTPIFIAVICVIIVYFILKKTALGMYIEAVGINNRAARLMGINSDMICWMCYIICGLCAGIAGVVNSSRIYSADSNNIGLEFEMDAILAVALGGNSLGGGKFSLISSIIGAYTIQALTTTLFAMGVKTEQAPVVKAIVIIIIVAAQAPALKEFIKDRKAKAAAKKVAKEAA